jgi:hypothetical protein
MQFKINHEWCIGKDCAEGCQDEVEDQQLQGGLYTADTDTAIDINKKHSKSVQTKLQMFVSLTMLMVLGKTLEGDKCFPHSYECAVQHSFLTVAYICFTSIYYNYQNFLTLIQRIRWKY